VSQSMRFMKPSVTQNGSSEEQKQINHVMGIKSGI
jgi:hypothetical protein